jgi:hypothetical protein
VGQGEQTRFTAMRDIGVKQSDWFIVGQGDLTFVSSKGHGPAVEVSGDPIAAGEHVTGRAAFYAKGTFASGWKVTSSLDTGETLLKDLFSNLDRKDPRQSLRRLNSNEYYTTYGDDSALVEDAPTQGRFYLKGRRTAQLADRQLRRRYPAGGTGAAQSRHLRRDRQPPEREDHQLRRKPGAGNRLRLRPRHDPGPRRVPGHGRFAHYLQRRDVTVDRNGWRWKCATGSPAWCFAPQPAGAGRLQHRLLPGAAYAAPAAFVLCRRWCDSARWHGAWACRCWSRTTNTPAVGDVGAIPWRPRRRVDRQ